VPQCPVQGTEFEVSNDVIVRHDVCPAMHTSCFHNYILELGAGRQTACCFKLGAFVTMEMEVNFGYVLAFKKIINNSLFECELVYRDGLIDRRTAREYMH
jgi:hypothetical protein